jgi:DNA ligase 1
MQPLVTNQFRERRELLHTKFKEIPGQFEFAKSIDSSSVEDIQLFLDASVVGKL